MALLVKQIMLQKRRTLMLRYFLIFFFTCMSISNAEIKDKIIKNLEGTKIYILNLSKILIAK